MSHIHWKNAINVADYYEHAFTREIQLNLEGGISCHGLISLQSRTKNLGGNPKAYI